MGVHQPLRRDEALQPPGQGDVGRPGVLAAGQPAHDQPVLRHDDEPGRGAGVHRRQGRAARRDRVVRGPGAGVRRPGDLRRLPVRLHAQAVGHRSDRPAGEHPPAPAAAVQLRGQLLQPPVPGDPGRRLHADRRRHPRPPRHRGPPVHGAASGPISSTTSCGPDPIDAYFEFEHGRLGYRTLDFERERARRRLPGLPGHELLRPRRAVHADHRAQALRAVGVPRHAR